MVKRVGLVAFSIGLAGCGSGGMGATPSPSGTSYASEMAACVAQMNEYRASVGAPALTRTSALEAYATKAAENDGVAHVGHQYFRSTNGGGIARAENEIPWWPLNQHGSVGSLVQRGLAGMWGEGPGGGHYENIRGPYTEAGCGVWVQSGEVTVVQGFR